MLKLTELFKAWLVENTDVEKDASDDDFRKAAGDAFASGKLSTDKYNELTADKDAEAGNEFKNQIGELTKTVGTLVDALAKGGNTAVADPPGDDKDTNTNTKDTPPVDKKPADWYSKMVARVGGEDNVERDKNSEGRIVLKGAWENYDDTKSQMTYPEYSEKGGVSKRNAFAGRPVFDFTAGDGGRAIDNPSDLDKAIAGSYAKFVVSVHQSNGSKTIGFSRLPEHDKQLLRYAMEKHTWVGASDGGDFADINGKLTDIQQKDLIDDAVSGGLEAAPIVFDDQVISTPLLNGELFPLVNQIALERGRRVEGVATGTVTGNWGGVDATAIALFNTNSYVSAFDTTIFRWQGAIRIGLDFLSDTPINFGAHITSQYGERLLEDLDDVQNVYTNADFSDEVLAQL